LGLPAEIDRFVNPRTAATLSISWRLHLEPEFLQMPQTTPLPRYIPLTHPGQDNPVFLLDSEAPLKDLQACAELRVSLVTRFLDTLINMKPADADESDLVTIASTAHLLLLEACDVHRVIEKRIWASGEVAFSG
jgi:hypothetical protein